MEAPCTPESDVLKRLERNKRRREQYNMVTDEVRNERNRKRAERRKQQKTSIQ